MQDAWVSVFVTSAMGIFFVLENIELNRILQEKDNEIEITKKTSQLTLWPKLNEIQQDIHSLRDSITDISAMQKDRIRHMRRLGGSSSST
jgi:hypothetical protein